MKQFTDLQIPGWMEPPKVADVSVRHPTSPKDGACVPGPFICDSLLQSCFFGSCAISHHWYRTFSTKKVHSILQYRKILCIYIIYMYAIYHTLCILYIYTYTTSHDVSNHNQGPRFSPPSLACPTNISRKVSGRQGTGGLTNKRSMEI